uniref:TAFH domain-containing protein n=1 Tax=Romanomermis culicivorax TaxID=13658 RepID=A0A915JA75_ROMCU
MIARNKKTYVSTMRYVKTIGEEIDEQTFYEKLYESTRFPLRPYVVPFMKMKYSKNPECSLGVALFSTACTAKINSLVVL